MNKYELTEKINSLQYSLSWGIPRINKETVLDLIEQLDEPQKPVVPQFVADWYENNKDYLEYNFQDWLKHLSEYRLSKNEQFGKWVNEPENNPAETLIKMKLFGYEVEKEPKYTVKVKAVLGQYLGRYYLNNEELTPQFTRTQFTGKEKLPTFTRKELEDTNFGWVFNCEGIEIEEVTE